LGNLPLGDLAFGQLVGGRLVVGQVGIGRVVVGQLVVGRLVVGRVTVEPYVHLHTCRRTLTGPHSKAKLCVPHKFTQILSQQKIIKIAFVSIVRAALYRGI
jgi:hypothetical protein